MRCFVDYLAGVLLIVVGTLLALPARADNALHLVADGGPGWNLALAADPAVEPAEPLEPAAVPLAKAQAEEAPAVLAAAREVFIVPTDSRDKSMPGRPAAAGSCDCSGGACTPQTCAASGCSAGSCLAGSCAAGACSSGACMTSGGGGSYRMKFRGRGKAGGRRMRGGCSGGGCGY